MALNGSGNWNGQYEHLIGNVSGTSNFGAKESPTTKTLGWHDIDMGEILKSYRFVVQKSTTKEPPYFELRNGTSATSYTPVKVFLEKQRYAMFSNR